MENLSHSASLHAAAVVPSHAGTEHLGNELETLIRLKEAAENRLRQNPDFVRIGVYEQAIRALRRLQETPIEEGLFAEEAHVPAALPARTISQADAAAEVLREHGKPMRTIDLVEPVRAKGARVSLNHPESSLSSSLSKDSRFEVAKVRGRRVWRLQAATPRPAA
ncbi:HTH domain-containing protein [Methylobacterium sp. ID0610]|uniref:HTH domain-containing protein n=1 Tax=Methylobacterium carpenticola TaxID=3344827 RepID=UPI0036A7564B